jgi:hypothetical protein
MSEGNLVPRLLVKPKRPCGLLVDARNHRAREHIEFRERSAESRVGFRLLDFCHESGKVLVCENAYFLVLVRVGHVESADVLTDDARRPLDVVFNETSDRAVGARNSELVGRAVDINGSLDVKNQLGLLPMFVGILYEPCWPLPK